MMSNGRVYLVGAGPGDEELITRKGYSLITKCDVLIYDRLVNSKLLDYTKKDCQKIYVGKTVGNHEFTQKNINDIIVDMAKKNKLVVRLKGGDPFVFGRGGEEILELEKNNIAYEVVPGISSAIAGLTYAGIPITHRGLSRGFHVVTGFSANEKDSVPQNLDVLAKLQDTIVFLMGFSNLEKIVDGLILNGKNPNTPVAIISNATTENQLEIRGTLQSIVFDVSKTSIKAPALIVVGDVTTLDFREKESKLSGVRIGVTGTSDFIYKQRLEFQQLGARVIDVCTYKIIEFDDYILDLSKYKWIAFTSANSVRVLFKIIFEKGIDLRVFSNIKFATVGDGTAEVLREYGFVSDYTPQIFSSKALAYGLCEIVEENETIFIPRAKKHTSDMTNIFKEKNICYDEQIVYDISCCNNDFDNIDSLDYLTFSSSKSVQEFFSKFEEVPSFRNTKIVCIGDITKDELEKYNIDAIKTDICNVEGLAKKICELRGLK